MVDVNRLIQRLHALRVADVMTHGVVQISPDQTLDEAAAVLYENGISGAPVVDDQGRCVGVVSAFDFVRQRARGQASGTPEAGDPLVRSLMSGGVRTVRAGDPVLVAARAMCAEHVHRLVVLDHQSRVIGLITSLDLVATLTGLADEQGIHPQ